jgi:hypothetical protein
MARLGAVIAAVSMGRILEMLRPSPSYWPNIITLSIGLVLVIVGELRADNKEREVK